MKALSKLFNWIYQTLEGKTETEILINQIKGLAANFCPVYLKGSGNNYYQVCNEKTIIVVTDTAICRDIMIMSDTYIYELLLRGEIEKHGYSFISDYDFEYHFEKVQHEQNLLKNSCLKYS